MPNNPSQPVVVDRLATNQQQPTKVRSDPFVLKLIRLAFQLGGRLSPVMTGGIAYSLWLTPTRFKTPPSEKMALATAEIRSVQIDGRNIITYHWGDSGPIVLLVHGWSGRGTQLGSFVEPLIKAGYRVLSFDAPAHGKSAGKKTNLFQVADTLVALQQHFGPFDSVISHSFGGPCVATAIQRGFKINCFVSIAPPANTLGLVEKFIGILRIPPKAGNNMIQRFEKAFGETIWEDVSMINTVKELEMPGLLIHDDNDSDIPWQEGHAVSQAWGNAEFMKTSNLGHRRILRDASVIESVVRFISDGKKLIPPEVKAK